MKLRIVLASPSDVQSERNAVESIATELNSTIAKKRGMHIEVSRWETDAYPGFHADGPQGLIDPILKIEDCDLLVGIFWKRVGTNVNDSETGTEHEFNTAYAAWKANRRPQIMMYFSERPYTPRSVDETSQWGRVLEFKRKFPKEGLWWSYNQKRDFERLIRNHLTHFILQYEEPKKRTIGSVAVKSTVRQAIRKGKNDLWLDRTGPPGVVAFYDMQQPIQQSQRNEATIRLINSGSQFSLLAVTALSYIDPDIKRHWDTLKHKLYNGASFRILLLNPFCQEKKLRMKLNYDSSTLDPKLKLELLIDLYNTFDNVNIRFSSNNIYCSLFFSDDEMIYDPYHLGKVGDRLENNFFALMLKRISDRPGASSEYSYFSLLKEHFEYLWSTADDFEVFLKRWDKELKKMELPRKIKPRR